VATGRTDRARVAAIRCIVSTEWFGRSEPSVHREGIRPIDTADRAAAVESVITGYDDLMRSLAEIHAPEFIEIAVTMPQAKVLYLLGAVGELHMSDLVARLGVSLSTVSGLVDRIVDQGLATRRDDPADRRQVVVALTEQGAAFLDRFRDIGAGQMRDLLALVTDDELAVIRSSLSILSRAADQASAATRPSLRKEPA
jgi:DNA-binding MarR family transcriptional regulator